MKLFPFFCSILFVFALSCKSEVQKEMDVAESLIHQKPDSSLSILRRIEPLTLANKNSKARYALLLSAAYDKNYIDVTSDSLIIKAVNYYSAPANKNTYYRMLAWYYLGRVQYNAQQYLDAIIALDKAEKEALSLNDNYQLGLINRNRAYIFNNTNNNPEAILSARRAVAYFDKAEAWNYKAYAELTLAISYSNNNDYSLADSLLMHIHANYNDQNLVDHCNIQHAGILVKTQSNPDSALFYYRAAPKRIFERLDFARYAIAQERTQNKDSADYWIAKAYSLCRNRADSATIDFARSRIEYRRGHYERAFDLVNSATYVQDSVTRVLLRQSVSCAQRDNYKNETVLQNERMKSMRNLWILTGIIGLLVLVLVSNVFIGITKRKDSVLKDQMAHLLLNKQEIERINKENAHLLGSLFSSRIAHLDTMADKYYKMEDGDEKATFFEEIKQNVAALRKDPEIFESLEKDLDQYCDGIMTKLRTQVPVIKGNNLKLISLFFAGIPDGTIQFILNKVSPESIRVARSRLRKVIIASGAPDADLFLNLLNKKMRQQEGNNES